MKKTANSSSRGLLFFFGTVCIFLLLFGSACSGPQTTDQPAVSEVEAGEDVSADTAPEASETKPEADQDALSSAGADDDASDNETGEDAPETDTESQASVEFFDTSVFDRKLSSALRGEPETLTISFPAPFTANDIPERLDKWFSMVEEYEGMVDIKAEPESSRTRSLITEAVSLVVGAYTYIKEKVIYGPAEDYNAILYYKPGGVITRVVFTRKTED